MGASARADTEKHHVNGLNSAIREAAASCKVGSAAHRERQRSHLERDEPGVVSSAALVVVLARAVGPNTCQVHLVAAVEIAEVDVPVGPVANERSVPLPR